MRPFLANKQGQRSGCQALAAQMSQEHQTRVLDKVALFWTSARQLFSGATQPTPYRRHLLMESRVPDPCGAQGNQFQFVVTLSKLLSPSESVSSSDKLKKKKLSFLLEVSIKKMSTKYVVNIKKLCKKVFFISSCLLCESYHLSRQVIVNITKLRSREGK